jgi:enoyl-CoA hydratase/carnithine racemase
VTYEQIHYAVHDHVATVTLNRPERLNAWTASMGHELRAAMRAARDDEAVRVIVLTGAGRGFCAGADMNALAAISGGDADFNSLHAGTPPNGEALDEVFDPTSRHDFQRSHTYFPAVLKPIIAAINGPCAGMGVILAIYSDLRFASDAAVFSTAFARRGTCAELGIGWILPRLVGMGVAADLLYSARKFGAAEAKEMRLVERVFRRESFAADVAAYASMLAHEVSPRAMREIKRQMWNAQFQGLGEAFDACLIDMEAASHCEDFQEGVAHFVEKRPPAFTGR